MKLTRDPRACNHPDLLSPDLNQIAIAWTGDQHYRAVFRPEGNQDTPLLGIYPMGSPCDQILVRMFAQAKALLAQDGGPAMYEVPFSGFTDHRGMEASGQGFSNAYKFTTAWTVQGTIGLMTPYGILAGGGCDKTFPMLIHCMGLEPYRYVPWALLHAGHRSVGQMPDGREVTIGDLAMARVRHQAGQASAREVDDIRKHTVTDVGVCENLASAMSHYLALCCGGFLLAGDDLHARPKAREAFTAKTTALFRTALERGIVPADVIGEANFDNYIKAIACFGLSTNLPLHLPFITRPWGITHTPLTIWNVMKDTPWISDLQPVGRYPVNHIRGMLPSVIKYLVFKDVLEDVTTLFGLRLSELYVDAADLDFGAQDVFLPLESPKAPHAPIALYQGNLCPTGAWVKEGQIAREETTFQVHVCPDQKAFFKDTRDGFQARTCYVISGDQSTIELLSVNFAITAALEADPDLDILMLTDQRTSGFAGSRAKAAYHLPRNRLRMLRNCEHVRFSSVLRAIDLVDADGQKLDAEMNRRAAAYQEPDWPKTGTVKDLINTQLSPTEEGAAIYG